jgi:hypothetical protein
MSTSRLITVIFGVTFLSLASQVMAKQLMIGWQEQVAVENGKFIIRAKIDTGADSTSINAVDPEIYQKSGRQWVRFSVQNQSGDEIVIDKPVIKEVRIKKKDGGRQIRKVIELDLCIGSVSKKVLVNLVDRSHFKFQLLIGRKFLQSGFVIDPAKKYTTTPRC